MKNYIDFLNLKFNEIKNSKSPDIILIIEYFTPKNIDRDNEFKFCILENLKNDLISNIIIFISDESKLNISHKKIQIKKINKRPTYKYIFDFCNQYFIDKICIISNGDIVFNETISVFKNINFSDVFFCLTRWDFLEETQSWELFPEHWGSQDSWIFKTPIINSDECDFLMGKPGCDSRIAHILYSFGYSVRNPSKQIITKHYHKSNYRTYKQEETIPGPYLLIGANYDINYPGDTYEQMD